MTLRHISGGLAALVLLAGPAWAQITPLYQEGRIKPGNATKFTRQNIVKDAGGLRGDVNGRGVAPFSVTDNKGIAWCSNSGPALNTEGVDFHSFCFGHDALEQPIYSIDGVSYPFGTGIGNVVGASTTVLDNLASWGVTTGTAIKDSGIYARDGRLVVPAGSDSGSTADTQAWFKLAATDPVTAARYGLLGALTYGPTTGSPWSSTLEGIIGLAYMQGAGTHNDFVFGVGGTAFLCESSVGPVCSPSTVSNSTGLLAGLYGSAEMGGAGTAAWLVSVFADGRDNIVHSGTATNNAALYITRPLSGTNQYGIFFAGGAAPTNGSIASNADISIMPGTVNAVVMQNTGADCAAQIFSTAQSGFLSGLGPNCGITITPSGTGIVTVGSTTPGTFKLRYNATAAAVPANFSATHYASIIVGSTTYYMPLSTAPW